MKLLSRWPKRVAFWRSIGKPEVFTCTSERGWVTALAVFGSFGVAFQNGPANSFQCWRRYDPDDPDIGEPDFRTFDLGDAVAFCATDPDGE